MNSKKSSNSKILSADQGFYYIHVTLYMILFAFTLSWLCHSILELEIQSELDLQAHSS